MSNTRTDSVELDVTNDEMKDLLDQNAAAAAPEKATKGKKNVFSRILAVLLTVAPVVLVCLFSVPLLLGSTAYVVKDDATLLDAFLALFSKDGAATLYEGIAGAPAELPKLFGVLPLLTNFGKLGIMASIAVYLFPVFTVLSVLFMLVAIFSGKKAPSMVRVIALLNVFLYGGYSLAIWAIPAHLGLGTVYNYVLLGVAAFSLLVYVGNAFGRARSKTWLPLLLLILTLAFIGAYVYLYALTPDMDVALRALLTSEAKLFGMVEGTLYTYVLLAFALFTVFNLFVSFVRVGTKKGLAFDIFRYLINVLFAGIVVYVALTNAAFKNVENIVLFTAIGAGIAVLLLLIGIIAKSSSKKKAKKAKKSEIDEAPAQEEAPAEEASEEPAEETTEEEAPAEEASGVYVEAVPYSYAVAEENVEVAETTEENAEEEVPAEEASEEPAEETTEEEAPAVAPAQTAGYDFYNSRSFDPFIASLNNEEREQFTNIFILKYQGETKNLPNYEVGGDNAEFFRKVFIFLGQYRDRIPDSLLAKMYQFAIKR